MRRSKASEKVWSALDAVAPISNCSLPSNQQPYQTPIFPRESVVVTIDTFRRVTICSGITQICRSDREKPPILSGLKTLPCYLRLNTGYGMERALDLVESDFRLPPTATGRQVRDAFTKRPELLCIAIVDGDRPLGLISRTECLIRYSDDFGPALYDRRPALLLADIEPFTIDADGPVHDLLNASQNASTSQLLKGFIVLRSGRFAGVSSLLALLRVTRAHADHLQFLNAELETAHEKAVAADAAKSRFLATMSHELRTPLNAILGYAEIISEECDAANETLRADAGRITAAGHHLLGLIDEVLDLSKLNARQVQAQPTAFDVGQWARDVIDMARPLAARNGNTLTLHVEAGLAQAFTDASRLRQCLFNLVGNACKFTSGGLVSVSIFGRDGMLHAKVSDTGIGMTEAQVAGLFQPFYQADSSITRRFGGTGLGLSITQQVATLLGGQVTVTSVSGAGSTFELIVPMRLGCDLSSMTEVHFASAAA